MSQIHPFWRAQLFLFDKPTARALTSQEGGRLLLIFLLMEAIIRLSLGAGSHWLAIYKLSWWPLAQVFLLTAIVFGLVISFAKVSFSNLGLYTWSKWSKTEKFYFFQTIPLAIAIFSVVRANSLKALWASQNLFAAGVFGFIPEMTWGFYQEFLYKGLLQNVLTQRFGAFRGILVSNLIFTFGPLHAYHFLSANGNPSHLWIFAAIFAIGLLFAILYHRSGNLWIIGIMHGLGDWFIQGLSKVY